MKVSRAQAEENRERILDNAAQLFRERGFDGIGLNDLMQAAGLTRGTLRLHGWVYKIETGEVFGFDPELRQYTPLSELRVPRHVEHRQHLLAL